MWPQYSSLSYSWRRKLRRYSCQSGWNQITCNLTSIVKTNGFETAVRFYHLSIRLLVMVNVLMHVPVFFLLGKCILSCGWWSKIFFSFCLPIFLLLNKTCDYIHESEQLRVWEFNLDLFLCSMSLTLWIALGHLSKSTLKVPVDGFMVSVTLSWSEHLLTMPSRAWCRSLSWGVLLNSAKELLKKTLKNVEYYSKDRECP